MGRREEPRTTAVAGEHERSRRGRLTRPEREEVEEILVSGVGVADMELHCLAGPDEVADGDHARFRIGADDIPDEKVASLETILILARDATDVERGADELAVGLAQFAIHLAEPFEGGPPPQLDDHVLLGTRDHHRPPDWTAALGDHRPEPGAAADDHPNGPAIGEVAPRDERVAAGHPAAAGHATDDRHAGVILLHPRDEAVDGERERIGQKEHSGSLRPAPFELRRPADETSAVGVADVLQGEDLHDRPRQPRQPDGHRRPRLMFGAAGQDSFRRRRDHAIDAKGVGQAVEGRPDRLPVRRRDKHDRERRARLVSRARQPSLGPRDGLAERCFELGMH